MTRKNAYIGIDIGTSSVRSIAIDADKRILARNKILLPEPENPAPGHYQQQPEIWWKAVENTLTDIAADLDAFHVEGIAVDGTSATLLLVDEDNHPLCPALMYNDNRAEPVLPRIRKYAATGSATLSATSSLAKLLYLESMKQTGAATIALHQADWISSKLAGIKAISDENNALKLGYDPIKREWPVWLDHFGPHIRGLLPDVFPVGRTIGSLCNSFYRFPCFDHATRIVTGTTDSTASTLATGISKPGQAVTTLGTTMVLKILSPEPVFAPESGIYSHRLDNGLWLCGGASNVGGQILSRYFSNDRIAELSAQINPEKPTGLDYYPLADIGERFPVNDATMQPQLSPRPASDILFLQAIFEAFAKIEHQGYQKLAEAGAPEVSSIMTAGGAASTNEALTAIRKACLPVRILDAKQTEAAFGSALIAMTGH